MGLSGFVAGGVQDSLEQVLERRLKELVRQQQETQNADQLALQRDQLASVNADRQAGQAAEMRRIDLADLTRRDASNQRGLQQMQSDRAQMDQDEVISSLPPHLKQIGGLMKIGAVGKLGPEDLEDPQVRATREAGTREQAIQDQIRVRNATREPREPRERKPEWVRQADGSVIDINGVAPAGTRPYDPVAERSSKPIDNTEAVDTAREAARLSQELLKHKGFSGAFGLADSYMPTVKQSTADAETLRDTLTSLLTLENMNKMKGVLSDSDMKLLKQASSTVNSRMSEGAARTELQRIMQVMSKVTGEASPSEQAAPAAGDRVEALLKKYGGG
jgi:hypothetical protein